MADTSPRGVVFSISARNDVGLCGFTSRSWQTLCNRFCTQTMGLKNKNQKKEKKVENEVDEPPQKRKKEMPTKDNEDKQEPRTLPSKKGKKEKKVKAKRKVDDESDEPPKKQKKEMLTKDNKEKPKPQLLPIRGKRHKEAATR